MKRNLQEIGQGGRKRALGAALALATLVAALGCQTPPQNACKGAPIMHCATRPVCAYDDKMECEVCRCAAPPYVPAQQTDPTQLPQPQPQH